MLGRLIGFDSQHVAQNRALARGELLLKTGRIEDRLTLLGGNGPEVLKGPAHGSLPVLRQLRKFLQGTAHIGLLLRGKVFVHLIALYEALAHFRRFAVEIVQAVQQALLLLRRKAPEAGLAAQCIFLLLWGEVLVLIEPLGKMARTCLTRSWTSHTLLYLRLRLSCWG